MTAHTVAGVTPAPARAYTGRAADPSSSHDVSTLALLRWWSVSVTDPAGIDPASLSPFHERFVTWWRGSADNRHAALVEESGGSSVIPVAVGWVVPAENLLGEVTWGARRCRIQGVYVVPGVAQDRVLPELHRVLRDVARDGGFQLAVEP